MGTSRIRRRLVLLSLLLSLLFAGSGCSYLGKYIQYRAEDMVEMLDIGISFSGEGELSLYACFASLACLGYADMEGKVLGMAGGQLGLIDYRIRANGQMYYGAENVRWGSGGGMRHYKHVQGLYAVMAAPQLPDPAYFPACTHYLHFFFIGVVANARYAEMLDFLIGFTTLDIACDDGRKKGKWFWQ